MKWWCKIGNRRWQVTRANCVECDKQAGFPVGAYEDCVFRNPYRMPIREAVGNVVWWLKTLWESPRYMLYKLGEVVASVMNVSATVMWNGRYHLIWVHWKREQP